AVLFYLVRLKANDRLQCLSAITTFTLLPVYHRFYDAGLLIIPLCCLIKRLETSEAAASSYFQRSSIVGLVILCPFVIPGGSLLERLSSKGALPAGLLVSNWWNAIVMAHTAWCLLLLSLVLLFQLY